MEPANIDVLKKRAEDMAGRPIEVEQLPDGKFIVMFMNFDQNPPPKGDTEAEALKKFIEYRLPQKPVEDKLIAENTQTEEQDGSNTQPAAQGSQDDSGA